MSRLSRVPEQHVVYRRQTVIRARAPGASAPEAIGDPALDWDAGPARSLHLGASRQPPINPGVPPKRARQGRLRLYEANQPTLPCEIKISL
jgi:hypothetical protein